MKLGDPVTGVLMASGAVAAGFVVDDTLSDRFFVRWVNASAWVQSVRWYADEGVTWVKGHLAKGSPEVCAMQAAWALECG